ncbi:MAG: DUF502 domain-containing protein [Hyphomonadaceae bacterium]|nr:DUF502 domain-containing protein [Hyphomonadaceae bacterium]
MSDSADADAAPRHKFHPAVWLRNSFAAGVALVLPFVVTGWLIWAFVTFVDQRVAPLLPPRIQHVAELIPGVGVIFAIAALTLVGALAGNLVGRFFVRETERVISNFPIVRSIYGGSKQVFKQVAAPERTSFQEAVLVEFPRPGFWAIGFVTNEHTVDVTQAMGQELIAVYVPQAPIPTSGFLFYLPRSSLHPLPIKPDEALQRVVSLGIIKSNLDDAPKP